jgi:hypothetical protein
VSYNHDAIIGWTTGAYQYTLVGGITTPTPVTATTTTPVVTSTTTTPVVTATTTPVATTTPTTGTGKFMLGDGVRVTRGPLNVRDLPSLRKPAKVLGTQPTNALGVVIDGPKRADNYNWWKINYNTGVDGWSTENYLTKTTTTPKPPVTSTTTATSTPIVTPILGFTTTAQGTATITQGTTATVSVAVNITQSNSAQTIVLSALNLPTGVTGTFNPATCLSLATGGSTCNVTLGLAALGSAPVGTYNFMVGATGLGQTISAPVALTVTAAGPVSTKFSLGDRVQATSNLNVRLSPSATASLIPGAPAPAGSVGTITGLAQPADGYAWWKVKFDNLAVDGWSVEDFLAFFTQIITPTPSVTTPDTAFDVGVNLEELTDYGDYTRSYMIVNVAKTWYQTQGTVGTDGWPNSASQFRVLTPVNADSSYAHPANVAGDYAIQVDGNTVISASGGTIKNLAYNSSTGKTTATLTVPDNLHDVNLGFSAPFKNAVVNRPGYPIGTTKVFTDEFKAAISPFKVLRLMDFMVTNRSLAPEEVAARAAMMGANGKLDWAERPNVNAPRWRTAFGAPVELAVQLANETGKDLWINISDYASDDYITGLASYLRTNLNSNSKVYLEYSNETWNYVVFAQAGAMRSNAAAYAATGATPTLDGQNNEYNAREYAMMQIIRVSNIFRNVFGDAAMPKTSTDSDGPRIRPIFADQMGSPAPALGALNWAFRKYPQSVNYYIWALAGAPYYTPLDRNASLDGLINETTGGTANLNRRANWGTFINDQGQNEIDNKQAQYYGFAQAYGLKFAAYEGGWDGGQGLTNLDNKVLASYDPRMEGVTFSHVAQGYTNGMRLFVYFHLAGANSRSGQWGSSDNIRDEGSTGVSPKLRGLIKAATADPRTFEQAPISIATGYFNQNTSAPVGNGTGLTGTYYQNSSFTGTPAQVRIDPILNFYWTNYGSGNPFPRTDLIGGDVNRTGGFSVKWRGGFLPRFTGSYKFTLETLSDSVAFSINGQNMVTNPTISLTAGSAVPLSIDYVPSSAGFSTNGKVRLFVEINGGRKILVPQSYLLPTL